jgi:hypothetical protein
MSRTVPRVGWVGLGVLIVGALLAVTLGPAFSNAGAQDRIRITGGSSRSPQISSARCPPLPSPSDTIVQVSTVSELVDAVNNASSGTTILVSPGTYHLDGAYLRFDTPGVTLRSASGYREAVVLDGNYITAEIIQIAASNVTIADLTLREAYYHPIHVMSSDAADTLDTRIYNVHIIDPGQQAIKINPHAAQVHYPDYGEIACSHIELTDAGRPWVWAINERCYTGGVDAHQARGWIIRDNLIEGFWCDSDLSEHGIHMWRGCRDTLVERNILRDNARGIGFGLVTSGDGRTYPDDACPGANGGYVDHYGGLVRNNFVSADRSALFASEYGFDCGICLWQACGAQVVHNTVASTQPPFSSIEWRFDLTDVDITNNLLTHNLLDRGGTARLAGNLVYQPMSLFVNVPGGDLHLVSGASAAIDQGVSISDGLCDYDIDGDSRPLGSARDVGADEFGIPLPSAVTDLRVTRALTRTGTLTAALSWSAPTNATTTTLRFSRALVTEDGWGEAVLLTDDLPGSAGSFTATVTFESGAVFFALKAQNASADWSQLSNNAFWPSLDVWLPAIYK